MREIERYSDDWFLDLYFQYGSVDEAIKRHDPTPPISPAQFHRLVRSRGIIKAAGRHASLAEVIHFFAEKAIDPHVPLERLYYDEMPREFRTSVQTLHRIFRDVERKIIKKSGIALIITPPDEPEKILVGDEKNADRFYGKRIGDTSLLMGFAKKKEPIGDSILRILQQEFSNSLTLDGALAKGGSLARELIPQDVSPFMYYDIVDVRVQAINLHMHKDLYDLASCNSYKLTNHRFANMNEFDDDLNFRGGVIEIIDGYKNWLENEQEQSSPIYQTSSLNLALARS